MKGLTFAAKVTVLEVIQRSTEFLRRKEVDSPRLQVELMLAQVLSLPRLKLYLDFERQLTEPELNALREMVKRRALHEPLQHILGSTSFCGVELRVDRAVLIPRPETEMLAERAWEFLRKRVGQTESEWVMALDFGTGSGCLAITLAQHVARSQIVAVDVSSSALAVARENAARYGLTDRIRFLEGNGFDPVPAESRFELIVSNPPYIPSSEIGQLAPEVRDYDPHLALDGGPDGLHFYRRLAAETPAYLAPGGRIMCEFGDGQAGAVEEIFLEQGWAVEEVAADLSGRPRILVARRTES